MDYGRSNLADRLAAEYALGTLRGGARRRFENLLSAHPGLRHSLVQWQSRLAPLAVSVAPVTPTAQVWTRIEARLFPTSASASASPASWWQRLSVWRGGMALACTALLAVLVWGPMQPPTPPLVVVLSANPDAAMARPARFVASLSPDGQALVLRAIDAPSLSPQQALELWSVPAAGAPRSLGLVRADGATTLMRTNAVRGTAAFAVSIEPAGGSPTGAPTGPVISVGKLEV